MKYHIPYNSKTIHVLRQIRERFNAVITIDMDEMVTIEADKKYHKKIKKLLLTII